ncbi:Crp/Fnr family transcriptional regulator [Hanstruepera marina]|uniref:Crp/Fnr family transcriptional regulator n=1 Tax=Hanstruepera marina TaxID=2873265 RepID=UPI001CA70C07|nr:Crp/Fnr family transcriptional regulator [Hanstruepera marina]
MNLNHNTANTIRDSDNYQQFLNALRAIGTQVSYKKDEVVFTEGGKADFILLVEDGILRTWRLVNDKEVVLGFTFPGDLEASPISFIASVPSKETIDAICNTTCLKISREAFYKQIENQKFSERIMQSILLEYIDVLIKRHMESKAYTAEENYINLLLKQPKLVNKIPLKDIASFLGISKERLSRIRKKHELT